MIVPSRILATPSWGAGSANGGSSRGRSLRGSFTIFNPYKIGGTKGGDGRALLPFMDLIADSVKLEGFEGFCGGLNMKSNHTETEFYYTQLKDRREIISQLCSLLSATINSSCSSRLWQNTSAAKTLTVPVPFKKIIMIQHQNFFGCNNYLSYSICLCKLFLLFTKVFSYILPMKWGR